MIPRVRTYHLQTKRVEQLLNQTSNIDLVTKATTNGGFSPKNDEPREMIRLNIGGRSVQLAIETIRLRLDNSRLAVFCDKNHIERLTNCDDYFEPTNEYYFAKSPIIFEYIIDYYIMGKLHRPWDMCPIRLRDEFDFWRIPLSTLAPCCRFDDNSPGKNSLGRFSSTEQMHMNDDSPVELFDKVLMGKARYWAYQFLENPRSSISAKIMSVVSAIFVLISLSGLILSSMPEFQIDRDSMTPHWTLACIEILCMVFFTLEYLARFIVSPQKCSFVRQPLNVIDFLTIMPFFIEECMHLFGVENVELRNLRGPMIVIRVLRVLRIARIFKLARYSIGLRAFGETMRKSAAELSMLGMFLLTGLMLFSTAIYFFERDEKNSKFYSIPAAWWWAIISMTTVGYGDLVPVTVGGKVVASIASVCGIIVLAFPISMILDKFAESTGNWKKNVFIPLQQPAIIENPPFVGNRYKSMRKSKRHVF